VTFLADMQALADAGGTEQDTLYCEQNYEMHFSDIVCNAGLAVPEACTAWCNAELCFVSIVKLRHFAACTGEIEACRMSAQAFELSLLFVQSMQWTPTHAPPYLLCSNTTIA